MQRILERLCASVKVNASAGGAACSQHDITVNTCKPPEQPIALTLANHNAALSLSQALHACYNAPVDLEGTEQPAAVQQLIVTHGFEASTQQTRTMLRQDARQLAWGAMALAVCKVADNSPSSGIDVFVLCNAQPYGPTTATQQGLMKVPWPELGFKAKQADAGAVEGTGRLYLEPDVRSTQNNTSHGLAALVVHLTSTEIISHSAEAGSDCSPPTQQQQPQQRQQQQQQQQQHGQQEPPSQAPAGTARSCKGPGHRLCRTLVAAAVYQALSTLKRETQGGWGTNRVEARVTPLLPQLAECLLDIVTSAQSPVLLPFSCSVLQCTERDLAQRITQQLALACDQGLRQIYDKQKKAIRVPAAQQPQGPARSQRHGSLDVHEEDEEPGEGAGQEAGQEDTFEEGPQGEEEHRAREWSRSTGYTGNTQAGDDAGEEDDENEEEGTDGHLLQVSQPMAADGELDCDDGWDDDINHVGGTAAPQEHMQRYANSGAGHSVGQRAVAGVAAQAAVAPQRRPAPAQDLHGALQRLYGVQPVKRSRKQQPDSGSWMF